MSQPNKRILSGMRTSSPRIHIGNYEGALRQWIELQNEYELFCMMADYHSLTTLGGPVEDLAFASREVAKDYVAAGLDPSKVTLFVQSQVPEHAELHLIFSMVTGVGKLERIPTYKEKRDNLATDQQVSYGLLGYPVLQSADILLYRPFGVPVGKDQAAHLELTREVGRSFNSVFGVEVFEDFKSIIPEDESRSAVPGLDMRKMSKSYNNCIYINESPDETAEKIMKAFTTPTKLKKTDPGIPEGCAVCQFLKLYHPGYKQLWDEDVAGERGCMQNKRELIEVMNEFLRPMRERRAQISDSDIELVLAEGATKAREFAATTMSMVRQAMKLL